MIISELKMNETEIENALGFILYNLCYHHKKGDIPLDKREIELLRLDDDDRKTRRYTYCTCLLWAKINPSFPYTSILLEKRNYSDVYIFNYLMVMLQQIEDSGVLEKFHIDNVN